MNHFEWIDIFSTISQEDQLNLSAFCQVQELKKWEILFHQWDEPQAMYVISRWRVLVQKEIAGEKKNVAMLGEGDLVWEIAFFGEPPVRNATIIADADTSVIVIIKFALDKMMEKSPELYEEVKNIIEERSK